jgi:hypothetical protein
MKKLFVVLVMVCFVLSVSGLSFAQVPSVTTLEKAVENPSLKGGDTKPAAKLDAGKMKAEEEKAATAKGAQDTVSTEKSAAEKAVIEKTVEEKAKSGLPKM